MIKTPLAWGFSFEQTENYKRQAHSKNLAYNPSWLSLGHYRRTILGHYKSKIRGPFFLSRKGARNPQAELDRTIEFLFASPEQAQAQCKYLARTRFLKQALKIDAEDLAACPERDAWKKKLNASEVYLVFASSDLSSAGSSFGHTFLRLHNPNNHAQLELLDYGFNFAAETGENDGAMFALKGLFGQYPGHYSMSPYHQKIRDYVNLEGRDIWEYKINFKADEVEMLIDHLLELEGSYVPYYFIDDNCSLQILELLEAARPSLQMSSRFVDATIPIDSLKMIAAQPGLLSGERLRASLQSDFQQAYAHLDDEQRDALKEVIEDAQLKIAKKASAPNQGLRELLPKERAQVLEAALRYLAIQEYRDQKNYRQTKYQLALQRASLGGVAESIRALNSSAESEAAEVAENSPLLSADSSAWYLGFGQRENLNFAQVKFRRAFHDLVSRDQGVGEFTHMEVLSATGSYEFATRRWDLEQFQALKIISTNPVTRLDHPLSWKVSFGSEPKLAPFFEMGAGASFDFRIGKASRWIHLFSTRGFQYQDHTYLGAGFESIFVQKWNSRFRTLQSWQYLGVPQTSPFSRAQAVASYDLSAKFEARLSYERRDQQNRVLVSLIF